MPEPTVELVGQAVVRAPQQPRIPVRRRHRMQAMPADVDESPEFGILLLGSSRSNAQANTVRTGMNELPTMAGRLQNRNEPTVRTGRTRTVTGRWLTEWDQGAERT